jgi:hypothetical protein
VTPASDGAAAPRKRAPRTPARRAQAATRNSTDPLSGLDLKDIHAAIDRYKRSIYSPPAEHPDATLEYLENAHVPQTLQFTVDCLPTIQRLLRLTYARSDVVSFADIGAATGAGADLISRLHRSDFLWCQVRVDAVDHVGWRADYSRFEHPLVNYIVGDIFELPESQCWDMVLCSHTIEHMTDPTDFIRELQRRARDWVVLYAPFEERQLRSHRFRVTREYVEAHDPVSVEITRSLGWKTQDEPDPRCVIFVLRGEARED